MVGVGESCKRGLKVPGTSVANGFMEEGLKKWLTWLWFPLRNMSSAYKK